MKKILAAFLSLGLGLSILYFLCLPHTVQMGDTGELVRSAYALQVPHPPGYPLHTLLNAAAVRMIPVQSIFWRASAFTAACAIMTCFFLLALFQRNIFLGVLFVLTLATSRLFWRFSVLPDVFALHALITAIILFIYFDTRAKKYEIYIPSIFLLGLSHHLTLIFLVPLVLHIAFKNIRERALWISSVLGFILLICSYSALGLLHPTHLDSWGNLTNAKAVLSHFLRSDYGTFRLVGSGNGGSIVHLLWHLGQQTFISFAAVLLVSLPLVYYRVAREKVYPLKETLLAFAAAIYIGIFFSLSNTELTGFRIETFERFFIFFHILMCFWLCHHFINWNPSRLKYYVATGVLGLGVSYNLFTFIKVNDFSKNTVIEDYAINFLNQTANEKSSVLITVTDTRYGALKYVQTVLGIQKNVYVLHPQLLFFGWYLEKALQQGLALDAEKILATRKLEIESGLILKNLKNFTFLTHLNLIDSTKYQIEMKPLGRKIQSGEGLIFNGLPTNFYFRSTVADLLESPTAYSVFYDLWTDYGTYYYNLGLAQKKSEPLIAAQAFKKSIATVPWYFTAYQEICDLEKTPVKTCSEKQDSLRAVFFDYF